MSLIIIGLGPGDVEDISLRAWRALESATDVYLRTRHHPCVPHLPRGPRYHSFDHLYETHADFAAVYAAIVAELLAKARQEAVIYAVPGDPMVAESAVQQLLARAPAEGVDLHIIHGISYIEPILELVRHDANDGLQILDALVVGRMYHPPLNPDFPALLAQVYNRQTASDLKLTLMNQYPDDFPVQLVHAAGTDAALVESLPLYEIDRSEHIGVMSALYLPAMGDYASFEAFQDIIAHLRAPEGCPWDRKQTHASLRRYLLEETYEALEAIDEGDSEALAGELGDLLLQIVLHTQIATEDGTFMMSDVLRHISHKMIRRHPHVWGDVNVGDSAEQVVTTWEALKQAERAQKGQALRESLLDGVPKDLPSLMTAYHYQAQAAKIGFDWSDVGGVQDKIREELEEIISAPDDAKRIAEIGDLMFALVNWLRWLGEDDPEGLLRRANHKFYRRFRYIEAAIAQNEERPPHDYTLAELDALWEEAKRHGL